MTITFLKLKTISTQLKYSPFSQPARLPLYLDVMFQDIPKSQPDIILLLKNIYQNSKQSYISIDDRFKILLIFTETSPFYNDLILEFNDLGNYSSQDLKNCDQKAIQYIESLISSLYFIKTLKNNFDSSLVNSTHLLFNNAASTKWTFISNVSSLIFAMIKIELHYNIFLKTLKRINAFISEQQHLKVDAQRQIKIDRLLRDTTTQDCENAHTHYQREIDDLLLSATTFHHSELDDNQQHRINDTQKHINTSSF